MSKVLRQCLAKNTTEQNSAWYYSLHFFIFFQQQSTSKHSHFFHFLYHINNFFITIRIKYSLKYNFFFLIFFFTFLYKFFLLYITLSFFINFKINNLTTLFCTCLYQTRPKIFQVWCLHLFAEGKLLNQFTWFDRVTNNFLISKCSQCHLK
jgi:hypothetical protein